MTFRDQSIAAPNVGTQILERWRGLLESGVLRPGRKQRKTRLRFTAAELRSELATKVIAPEAVLAGISQVFAEHFVRGTLSEEGLARPESILVLGASGSGKSLVISEAAAFCQIPTVHCSGPSMTAEGIRGQSVSSALHTLTVATGEAPRAGDSSSPRSLVQAQRGVLVVDEVCKLDPSAKGRGTTYGTEVMNALLRVCDGCNYQVETKIGHSEISYSFNTSKLLIVFAGAFEGITGIVAKRLGIASRIGFAQASSMSEAELYSHVIKADLLAFGFSEQFLGRINRIFVLPSHSLTSLRLILANPISSPLARQRKMLESVGVGLEVTDGAIDLLAEEAFRRARTSGMGARLLSDLVEEVLAEVKYVAMSYGPLDISITSDHVSRILSRSA